MDEEFKTWVKEKLDQGKLSYMLIKWIRDNYSDGLGDYKKMIMKTALDIILTADLEKIILQPSSTDNKHKEAAEYISEQIQELYKRKVTIRLEKDV